MKRKKQRNFRDGGIQSLSLIHICLVHISQLDVKRTEKVTDVVNVDDIILVKVLEIDEKGRLNPVSYTHLGRGTRGRIPQ